ncbi:hypothetical protein OAO87_04315, partial [bacterium]|nr:hypothetical protein [bacterium]
MAADPARDLASFAAISLQLRRCRCAAALLLLLRCCCCCAALLRATAATLLCSGLIVPRSCQSDLLSDFVVTCTVGCVDPNAISYNVSATTDDGSCTYHVVGCTDSAARNYAPDATVSRTIAMTQEMSFPEEQLRAAECIFSVLGCMSPTASNF